jgi:tetratricopeptide (TPR) repeat protein
VSVQDMENRVRSHSHRKEYSTSRSRRDLQREANGPDRYLSFGVALVVAAYLAFLVINVVISRGNPPAVVKDDAVVAPVEPVKETVQEPESAVDQAEPPLMLEKRISDLKRAKVFHEEGTRFARDKKYGEADERFGQAAELMPDNFALLYDWANSLLDQKRWAAANEQLVKAVSIDPRSVPARIALAQSCYQIRQMPEALALANWVLESESYSEAAHQIAADVLLQTEQYESAILHLEKLVALNSNNHIAENNLGSARLRQGQYAQAIRTFEHVIHDEPGNSQAYYYLAICFMQRKENDLAVDVLIRASTQFGREFVLSWTKSAEFESLQASPSFQQYFAVATSASTPAP